MAVRYSPLQPYTERMEATLSTTDSHAGALTAEELCRRYAPSVCRFAAMIATSSPDADDLAQDALLRAVRGRSARMTRPRAAPKPGCGESWSTRLAIPPAVVSGPEGSSQGC